MADRPPSSRTATRRAAKYACLRVEPAKRVGSDTAELSSRFYDLPADIYVVIIEHCSHSLRTLANLCLVSPLTYRFARPMLYRRVELELDETEAPMFMNALRGLIKGNGRYVEYLALTISCEIFPDYIDSPVSYQPPINGAVSMLASLAIEQMDRLKSFKWTANPLFDRCMRSALNERAYLRKLVVKSDTSIYQHGTDNLDFSGFRSLQSLAFGEITSAELLLQVRTALDSLPALRKLRLLFPTYWHDMTEPGEVDLFDLLFSIHGFSNDGTHPELLNLTLENYIFSDLDFGFSFQDGWSQRCERLDCLTIYGSTPSALEVLDTCEDIRLRKLRVQCDDWEAIRSLLANSKLELLHLELTKPGFHYPDLIPLVCRSADSLTELRLEWGPEIALDEETEPLSHRELSNLSYRCRRIRHLSLRADIDFDEWGKTEKALATSWTDLVSFKLRAQKPKPGAGLDPRKPPPASKPDSASESNKPAESVGAGSSKHSEISIENFQKLRIAVDAASFASAFVRAAAKKHILRAVVSLKYMAFDDTFYEIYRDGKGQYVFSEIPVWRAEKCGGVFAKDKLRKKFNGGYDESFFRLSKID